MRRADPWLVAGLVGMALLLVVAIHGERLAPLEAIYSVWRVGRAVPPFPPGEVFPLGSDNGGRDLLSLVLIGARATLALAVAAGLLRVAAGALLAALASRVRPVALLTDAVADVVAGIPATLVAVVIVVAFFGQDASATVFLGAIVATGWGGPYRIVRAELARLGHTHFAEAAVALGLRGSAILARHYAPHLAPISGLVLAQQVVASLVAIAELGVLGIFVGPWRFVNSPLACIGFSCPRDLRVPQVPELGGMLANARTIENLYLSRWVFLVPAAAIALAALAFTVLGVGIARQWTRGNLIREVGGRGALAMIVIAAAITLPGLALPERYATAADAARRARAEVPARLDEPALARALEEAGLRTRVVERTTIRVERAGDATLAIRVQGGERRFREGWGTGTDFAAVAYEASGSGPVEAKVVFLGWGIGHVDYDGPFGSVARAWEDAYAAVDVRGKIGLILAPPLLLAGPGFLQTIGTPSAETVIGHALRRGAAGVLYVDRFRLTAERPGLTGNLYRGLEQRRPSVGPDGPPVLIVDPSVADAVLASSGRSASAVYADLPSARLPLPTAPVFTTPIARETPTIARLEVPLKRVAYPSRSVVGAASGADVLLWAIAPSAADDTTDAPRALVAALLSLPAEWRHRAAAVAFDPRGETDGNARAVREWIASRPKLVVAIDSTRGDRLRLYANDGSLLPIIDHYAERATARFHRSLTIATPDWATGVRAFRDTLTVVLRGDALAGDRTADAAAIAAYAVARAALGAPELH